MTFRPARTWAETTRSAEAMDDVIELVAGYLPHDSGISQEAVVSEIIRIIEEKTGHRFTRTIRLSPSA